MIKFPKRGQRPCLETARRGRGHQKEPATQACRITVLDELGGKPASRDPSIPWKIGW